MIIDAHSHIFPRLGSPSGGEDPLLNQRMWQYHMRDTRRFQRQSDGVVVEEQLLQWDNDDMRDMPDAQFRLTDFGKVEIRVGGVDYVLNMYPPDLQDMA